MNNPTEAIQAETVKPDFKNGRTTFKCCKGRRRRLIRLTPNGAYHIRFAVGEKRFLRSLGTTIAEVAIAKAKQLIAAAYGGDQAAVRQSKVRSDYPLLRTVCDLYVEKFGTDRRRRRTALQNVNALARVVRLGCGLTLDQARASVLTAELVRRFEEVQEKGITHDSLGHMEQGSELRIRNSLGSTLLQARSIFKRGTMNWFKDFGLPKLESFREQSVTAADRPKPQPLDDGVMEAINAAAPRLALEDPPVYSAHLLFKFLGMRNGEIRHARKSWIIGQAGGGGKLGVIYRPEEAFKPKKKTERWIPIAPAVLAEILKFAEPAADGFLVPAPSAYQRMQVVDYRHSIWAGRFIQNRTKTSYELRRYAGSLVYKKTGRIEYVQQFLGHANLGTTTSWYWYLLGDVPALEPSDFAPSLPSPLAVVA